MIKFELETGRHVYLLQELFHLGMKRRHDFDCPHEFARSRLKPDVVEWLTQQGCTYDILFETESTGEYGQYLRAHIAIVFDKPTCAALFKLAWL